MKTNETVFRKSMGSLQQKMNNNLVQKESRTKIGQISQLLQRKDDL